MNGMTFIARTARLAGALAFAAVAVTGCPEPPFNGGTTAYDRGFDDGFARDGWYWDGYWDGFDTIDHAPIYYQGGEIPYIDDNTYDAGFYDGVWWAYNDGYFVDYHYAFLIGFSEGYDLFYRSNYLNLLAGDQHTEFFHGGWIDGYHDGFSEGRIFGANDFEQGIAFDWLDALLDYEDGVDLYFEEVDLGTGELGPVFLYEYGTDPHTFKNAATEGERERAGRAPLGIREERASLEKLRLKAAEMFRQLTEEAKSELRVQPEQGLRARDRSIERLNDTWLDRVNRYLGLHAKDGDGREKSASPRLESPRLITTP